jgi:hypothetical protein
MRSFTRLSVVALVGATARNLRSGETCSARVVLPD